MLTLEQNRAARALLRWSARELAEKAGVHITTVQRMECDHGPVGGTVKTFAIIQGALEDAGLAFTSQNGYRRIKEASAKRRHSAPTQFR